MKLSQAEIKLSELDADMAKLIAANGHVERDPREGFFPSLARSIVGQQISVKAAAKILERFEAITEMDPGRTAALTEADAKTIGLSGQKYKYLRDLADHFVRDSMVFDHLDTLSDDEVVMELTKVKGIGIWTAQMFLMFTLVRPDVFAPGDRGLQLAIQRLYSLPEVPAPVELEQIAAKWSPYRTLASYHLWHSLDNEPV
ncbi:MAG: DNA-3-methyladenine glycosylase [Candidatus Saccharibacteria bacterium]|nr:DNA-3-methyladenine glycosylase [Candidatus Saccharibacteria bacterium]